jgi:hypothetical protein
MGKDDDGSVFMIGESVSGRRDDGAGRGRETTARGENGPFPLFIGPFSYYEKNGNRNNLTKTANGIENKNFLSVFPVTRFGSELFCISSFFFWIKQEFQVTGQEVMEHEYSTLGKVSFSFLWLPND